MSLTDDIVYDVIVVGGGVSGATAAYRLHQVFSNKNEASSGKGHKILLLEAKERLGGRTLTTAVNVKDGQEMFDLGGQWVGRTQHHVMWLMKELGIEHCKQFITGSKFIRKRDGKIYKYTSNPKLSVIGMLDFGKVSMQIGRMSEKLPLDDPTKCKEAEEWDSMTVETFLKKATFTKDVRSFMETFITFSGSSSKECSLLYLLRLVACSGYGKNETETGEGSPEEFYIKGGAQQIAEKAANEIGTENVWLNEPVTHVDQSDIDYVTVETESGKKLKTKYVIMSAPINCVENIVFKPDLPVDRHYLAQRMPPGHLLKFIVTYKKAFWREAGFSGEVLNIGDCSVASANPIVMVIDACRDVDTSPALLGLFGNSRQWRKVEVSERRREVIKELVEYFGPEANDVIDYVDKDWAEEPYNGGCPGNFMTTGAMTLFYDSMNKAFDRVHWAGTETATRWISYLSGAVQSGLRAADEILDRIDPSLPKDGLLESLDKKNLIYSKNAQE